MDLGPATRRGLFFRLTARLCLFRPWPAAWRELQASHISGPLARLTGVQAVAILRPLQGRDHEHGGIAGSEEGK